jgi:hypothetical protein
MISAQPIRYFRIHSPRLTVTQNLHNWLHCLGYGDWWTEHHHLAIFRKTLNDFLGSKRSDYGRFNADVSRWAGSLDISTVRHGKREGAPFRQFRASTNLNKRKEKKKKIKNRATKRHSHGNRWRLARSSVQISQKFFDLLHTFHVRWNRRRDTSFTDSPRHKSHYNSAK